MKALSYLLFLGILISPSLFAQDAKVEKKELINLLKEKEYTKAATQLEKHLKVYRDLKNLDSLASYTYYVGKVKFHLSKAATAIEITEKFIIDLKNSGASDRNLFTANMGFVHLLDELGRTKMSYDITEKVLDYAIKMPDNTKEEIGYVYYNLGASALSLGDFNLAKMHFRKTLQNYETYEKTSGKKLADAYNAMGAVMWLSTKLDSAQFYYKLSVDAIHQSQTDSISKYFLSAITLSNVALIQQGQGKTAAAMKTLQTTLHNYQMVIKHSKEEGQMDKAKRYQWYAMSNLAVFYNDIGDFSMANTLLEYVLESQSAELQPDDIQLTKTQIKIAQSLLSMQKYKEAKPIFSHALEILNTASGEENYWIAISLFGLAETEEALGNITTSKAY
ncbi:MAG: tetratricopeptide repeat protein, partial [Flavobacteriales bacterium]|nr:tetratricopeptide repeat protein [Flavobacteriales bacterium]